jgi:hypothetical protein
MARSAVRAARGGEGANAAQRRAGAATKHNMGRSRFGGFAGNRYCLSIRTHGSSAAYAVRPITASDEQGISVCYKDETGEVFHTYSCHARGIDMVNGAYHFLDLVPKGRAEDGFKFSMEWLRLHDQY